MHKMAFHRARIISIIECTLAELGLEAPRTLLAEGQSLLSEDVAPELAPTRAEVFLPYSLPGLPLLHSQVCLTSDRLSVSFPDYLAYHSMYLIRVLCFITGLAFTSHAKHVGSC